MVIIVACTFRLVSDQCSRMISQMQDLKLTQPATVGQHCNAMTPAKVADKQYLDLQNTPLRQKPAGKCTKWMQHFALMLSTSELTHM